jgi:dipeptidyl aminopeptidase/acylaminoacyl peptidase
MIAAILLFSSFFLQMPAEELSPEVVSFPSGNLTLSGFLYKPEGPGPFPAVLYNHGSAAGLLSNEAFNAVVPVYLSKGWVFFAPYRRGQGLSASQGSFIGDRMAGAQRNRALILAGVFAGCLLTVLFLTRRLRRVIQVLCFSPILVLGLVVIPASAMNARTATMLRLLETDHLNDQIAAYAWLRQQAYIQPNRIAVAGNSFGGIQTILGAERLKYCAAIDAAGAAESWSVAPELQRRLVRAAQNTLSPVFFFQAENDYDLSPSRTLYAAITTAGKVAELKIYPSFGRSPADGHSFAWAGHSVWADDVLRFLAANCGT